METIDVRPLLTTLTEALRPYLVRKPLIVGIHSGGAWVAEQVRVGLAIEEALGTLDISFYRDDFTQVGMHPEVKTSHLPVNLENRHVILVDDVLHTGRTVRAALNELFDYGRPASVVLAVLVDRDGRELPVQADVRGHRLDLPSGGHVKLVQGASPYLKIQECSA